MAYRVLGSIPGPVMFGVLIDNSCLEWQGTRPTPSPRKWGRTHNPLTGSCQRYDLSKLRSTFVVTSGLSAIVSTLFFFAMKVLYVEPEARFLFL